MHKIFAKPLFLGKKVVFLPQCHSTNDQLMQMAREKSLPEGTLLYTDEQPQGKGQRGNVWISEPGKNILMSLLIKPKFLIPAEQFYLNLVAGLAVLDTMKNVTKKDLSLKWPNDVFLNEKKVSGILIESNLRGSSLESAIVGIGINVNQKGFGLASATSLVLETEEEFDREELLELFLCQFEKWYMKLRNGDQTAIKEEYHKQLMWRGEIHTFNSNEVQFEGEIIGIDNHGNLAINVEGRLKTFGIKEVQFVS